MFVAGLTLEQASNGSPARGMADGENAAWCIYTPNADFGNAEVTELYYPILFLGRNIEPDSGGYGKFRGGLGHTAVWMVKNTPGIEYQCGCAGMRSKVTANHGMFGAYPTWPDRASYASGTNMKALIEAQQPLVHERGEPTDPTIAKNITAEILETNAIAPFVTPHQLHEYDLIIHPISGAQALGDPIERDPAQVKADLDAGWTREWVAANVYGVVAHRNEKTNEWTRRRGRHGAQARRDPPGPQGARHSVPRVVAAGARTHPGQGKHGERRARHVARLDGAVPRIRPGAPHLLAAAGGLHFLDRFGRTEITANYTD